VHDPPHAGLCTGARQRARQRHVCALELGFAAVQDRHQVDDRVAAAQQRGELRFVVHVGGGDAHRRQQLQVLGTCRRAARHHHLRAAAARALDQRIAQAAADETGAAEDQEVVVHAVLLAVSNRKSIDPRQSCITPEGAE
jgi:hypothetical protein